MPAADSEDKEIAPKAIHGRGKGSSEPVTRDANKMIAKAAKTNSIPLLLTTN